MPDFNNFSLVEKNLYVGAVESTSERQDQLQPTESQSHTYEFDTGYNAYESAYAVVGPFKDMVSM